MSCTYTRPERFIGSARRECLDHFIVIGEAHLRRMLKAYASYYNPVRTHLECRCTDFSVLTGGRRYRCDGRSCEGYIKTMSASEFPVSTSQYLGLRRLDPYECTLRPSADWMVAMRSTQGG